ncbi:uncharacterized protein FIBRA_06346 [Fibroporia radiculosa]|uniref:Rho-GAP domain-containing protein n=1 Tax=Fibroporia radiculosa TaxID=599839 RepID=J4H411_9APHY|nr:uncharacterized protein FIBRA_06346 [Fibroporia radiculosa]CCM04184.1 predicted protein [Fibroporia radiculosa]
MAASEERYSPSSWDNASDNQHSLHQRNAYSVVSGESVATNGGMPLSPTKSDSTPRSSVESPGRYSSSQMREGVHAGASEGTGTIESVALVDQGFDESVLRALCKLNCGIPLLNDRIKQSLASCKEAVTFFKKRAMLEEEYGRNLHKLARATNDAYATSDGKAGSYVSAWHSALRNHEQIAQNKMQFAARLHEMCEDLNVLIKEVDKNRKVSKDMSNKYEKSLNDSTTYKEKCKAKFDATAEELERLLMQKEGEPYRDTPVQGRSPGGVGGKRAIGKAVAKGGMLLKGRNPGNLQRQEEDVRARMSRESDAFRDAAHKTQGIRQEYYNFQYPRLLRALKECVDEIDLGLQYHLIRYGFLCESTVLQDGLTLTPLDETGSSPAFFYFTMPTDEWIEAPPGLKATLEAIDNRTDFNTYMQSYSFTHEYASNRGPSRDDRDDDILPPIPPPRVYNAAQITDRGRPTFGVDLAEQMARDDVDVPPIVVKCCEALEKYGLESQGLYRVGGPQSKINKLKEMLDRDLESVNLDLEEWSTDTSNVTSVLKMWFRELPDPLFTTNLHRAFIDAAYIENERLRHIRLHERINELPDPNYATLKYFMGHLHKVTQYEAVNSMGYYNLSVVFGPTLFGPAPHNPNDQTNGIADANAQNKAVETILEHYTDIFVDENEEA